MADDQSHHERHPALDLRPGVTVLTGLDHDQRTRVVADARALVPSDVGIDPVIGRFALCPVGVDERFDALRVEYAFQGVADPRPLRAALERLRSGAVVGASIPSPEALRLAERLRRAEAALADPPDPVPPEEVDAAERRVTAARSAVAEQEDLAGPRIRQEDLDELERAHAAVLEATEGLDRRFGAKRAEQRHEEAVAAERAVLDRLGLRSYTEFMTGGMRTGRPMVGSDALVEARQELVAAERALDVVRRRKAAADAHEELVADHERLCAEGRELLGDDVADSQLRDRLLAHRVQAEVAEPAQILADALATAGLQVGTGRTRDDLEAIVVDWLRADDDGRRNRVALEIELEQLTGRWPPDPEAAGPLVISTLAQLRGLRSPEGDPVALVVDRAVDPLDDDELDALLDRLDELAGDVPVVHLSDDPRIVAWGSGTGR